MKVIGVIIKMDFFELFMLRIDITFPTSHIPYHNHAMH